LFDFAIGAQADTWVDEVQKWFLNPNTDIKRYYEDGAGFLYWLRFSFVCNFPENLNCSIGEPIETVFLWLTVAFIGLALVGAYAFPLATLPFQILGYGLTYFLFFMAVAFHAPAACLFMFPAFPVPVGIAIPECVVDRLIEFLDKWITNCYSPLLLPPYMISGELCPTDPMQYIDILNCRDVGVSDGIQNLLWLGVQLFGQGFIDVMITIAGSVIGVWIPGLQDYMQITLLDMKNANPTQMERMTFCFYATLPTLALPAVALFLGILIIGVLVTPLVLVFNSLIEAFMASPGGGAVPGGNDEGWYGDGEMQPEGEGGGGDYGGMEGDFEPAPAPPVRVQSQLSWVGTFMNLARPVMMGKSKIKVE